MAVVLLGVPLGGQSVHVAAAAGEPTRTEVALTPSNLDATGTDITKWKKNGDVYETQNQGSNSTPCTMEVPVEVTAGYAELEFEWKVSSEADYDFLRFELKDADTGDVLQSNQKSGEETAFDNVVLKLDKGTYTLTFTYQGDGSSVSDTCFDTGYVKNLNLVTYSGVSAISKTMFAEPDDLTNSDNFSLATADYSKVGKISFGTRPGEVKYYKRDWRTPYSVGTAGTPTPITWLIAGSDADNGLVLYSEEPLVSAFNLRGESKMNSKFQPTFTYELDGAYWVGSGATKDAFDGSWGTYSDPPSNVYANHWGASNLRNVLNAIYNGSTLGEGDETADYSGFFNATEKGLMSESTINTYDMQDAEFDDDGIYVSGAQEYTTTDYLYAPRLNSTTFSYPNNKSVTVGGTTSLAIGAAHWGSRSWLRSPDPKLSGAALVALPDAGVGSYYVDVAYPSLSAAFRLNLSSVLFASAASPAGGGKFEAISADTPMTLRVAAPAGTGLNGVDAPKVEAGAIKYTNASAGARLMVLATGSDGATYQYFNEVSDTGSLALSDITSSLPAGMTYTARAWLETDDTDGSTVTYATKATDAFTFCTGCTLEEVPSTATCTAPGHQAHYKCSVCGQLFSDAAGTQPIGAPTQVAALGHKWDDGVVATQPTASASGVKTYTCSVCGHTRTETIPMLDWGSPMARADGKTQYVVDDPSSPDHGKTSIEIKKDNLSQGDILWLLEESDGTSAWYGVDLSSGAFDLDNSLRFYVQWLSPHDAGYAEVYAQLDDAQKARVEADNGWIFLIGVEDPAGNKVQPSKPVSVYVQIGDDWDVDDLNAYYITSGGDENVPVDYLMLDYPGGTDTFGRMTLEHFSPYIIFDELTDEEKAALTPKPNDNSNSNNQTTDKPNSSGTDLPGTGDLATQLLISALAIVLVSSLGVMLRLLANKRKLEE